MATESCLANLPSLAQNPKLILEVDRKGTNRRKLSLRVITQDLHLSSAHNHLSISTVDDERNSGPAVQHMDIKAKLCATSVALENSPTSSNPKSIQYHLNCSKPPQ
jgi:hypothetical protein